MSKRLATGELSKEGSNESKRLATGELSKEGSNESKRLATGELSKEDRLSEQAQEATKGNTEIIVAVFLLPAGSVQILFL